MESNIKISLGEHIRLRIFGWFDRENDPTNGYYFKCEKNIHGIVHVPAKDGHFMLSIAGNYVILNCPKCKENTYQI
jgi:hypothetical protein